MPNTIPLSRLGLIQGGSDNFALFLTVAGGEVLRAFEEQYMLSNLTGHKFVAKGSKGAQFRIVGRSRASRHTPGENLLVPDVNTAGVNAAKNTGYKFAKKTITPDENPHQVSHIFNDPDTLMTPDGDEDRLAITDDMARAVKEVMELTWFSQIMQNSMSVDSMQSGELATTFSGDAMIDSTAPINMTRLKRNAAYKAGLTDSSPSTSTQIGGTGNTFKGNSFGYHINAMDDAAKVKTSLRKMKSYFGHLRIPGPGRFCMIASDTYDMLSDYAGTYTGSGTPLPEWSNQINGGGGNLGQMIAPVIATWSLIPTPYLTGVAGTGLGTQMEDILNGSTAPTLADDKRYQLAVAPNLVPSFAENIVAQRMVQHQASNAASAQPDAWAEWRDLFDKTVAIVGHSSCIGTAMMKDLQIDGRPAPESNGNFMVMRAWMGHGNLRPEASAYIATAKVSAS